MNYIVAVLTFIITFTLCLGLHEWDVYRIEAQQQVQLQSEANVMKKQCDAEKAITQEVSNDYRKKLVALNSQLDDLKRVRPDACISVSVAKSTDRGNAAAKPDQHADTHGVDSYTLYSFAAESEQYRLQLVACQTFITDTWKANGQPVR